MHIAWRIAFGVPWAFPPLTFRTYWPTRPTAIILTLTSRSSAIRVLEGAYGQTFELASTYFLRTVCCHYWSHFLVYRGPTDKDERVTEGSCGNSAHLSGHRACNAQGRGRDRRSFRRVGRNSQRREGGYRCPSL